MRDPFTDLEHQLPARHLTLLEACRDDEPGVSVVYTATRQQYGRPQYLPVDERHPMQPVDVNGVNKLAGRVLPSALPSVSTGSARPRCG